MRRALLLVLSVLMLSACAGLFFQPYRQYVRTPADIDLAYEDAAIETEDDVRLHGWFLPAKKPACATVLFLHGNAENISTHIASVYWMPERGFNVLLLDYRGYGASGGAPSFGGMQTDIDAAMTYLLARPDAVPGKIVLFGQSLGGAAAIYYAAHGAHRSKIHDLVVESAFASYRGIVREKLASFWLTWPFQWLPALTISDAYSPVAAIGSVAPTPLLLIYGDGDNIVPIADGETLFAAAHEPKVFWKVPGGGHIAAFQSQSMRERLVAYLRPRVCPESARSN